MAGLRPLGVVLAIEMTRRASFPPPTSPTAGQLELGAKGGEFYASIRVPGLEGLSNHRDSGGSGWEWNPGMALPRKGS